MSEPADDVIAQIAAELDDWKDAGAPTQPMVRWILTLMQEYASRTAEKRGRQIVRELLLTRGWQNCGSGTAKRERYYGAISAAQEWLERGATQGATNT